MSAPAGNILDRIVASTRQDVDQRKRRVPVSALMDTAVTRPRPWADEHRFLGALAGPGLSVIAEFKRRSPSAGPIREGATVAEVAAAYERGGAAAISVLTEGPHFEGSLEDLREARAACDLPLLRKDFLVDAYQLHEARAAGADAVLLIAAALPGSELAQLHAAAADLALDVLVEVHDEAELETALSLGPAIVGINNRDLRDFSVDVGRTFELATHVPDGVVVVSESGFTGPDQLRALSEAGVDAVLVGESLMRAEEPEAALRAMVGFGR